MKRRGARRNTEVVDGDRGAIVGFIGAKPLPCLPMGPA